MGLNNELYTAERAAKLKKQNAAYYSRGDKWIGRYCSDCSGGIVGAMRIENPNYGDRKADTFAAQFDGGKQPIATIPDARGVAVWKSGHIGVYVGGGYAIEFRGIDYGCVRTTLASRPWTHWGYIRDVEYSKSEKAVVYPMRMTVNTTSGTLNLRDAPINGTVLARMPKNAVVYALGDAEVSGWLDVLYDDGTRVYRGSASKKYLR